MKTSSSIPIVVLVALLLSSVAMLSGSDADGDLPADRTVYAYGDMPTLINTFYTEIPTGVHIRWYYDNTTGHVEFNDVLKIELDLQGMPRNVPVRVTTVITGDGDDKTFTIDVYPMKVSDSGINITFHDGSNVAFYVTLSNKVVIERGQPFFNAPELGDKDGFKFLGWYSDDDFTRLVAIENEQMTPVTGDLHYYAKWARSLDGITINETIDGRNINVYAQEGLEVDVTSNSSTVDIEVGVIGGYVVDRKVTLTSNGTIVSPFKSIDRVSYSYSVPLTGDLDIVVKGLGVKYIDENGQYVDVDIDHASTAGEGSGSSNSMLIIAIIALIAVIGVCLLYIVKQRNNANNGRTQ